MLEINNIKVYDLKESIIACRNSMRINPPEYNDEEFNKGLERAKKLVKAGSGHDNFLKGIRVSFDLKYPNYISPELQRYNWFDIVCSSSKMHKIMEMDFELCCNKYVSENTKNEMRRIISEYKSNPCYKTFIAVISNCPQGIELFMRISTNYLQLKTIYFQRKDHRLKEDWGAFIDFIEKLPLSEELIISKN